MTPEQLAQWQDDLGLSDERMARALGLTRQTWRNWRVGHSGWKRGRLPPNVQTALRYLWTLMEVDPHNHTLPADLRGKSPPRRFETAASPALSQQGRDNWRKSDGIGGGIEQISADRLSD
ncbi:MAG: hypothetical protein IBJ04_18115 [Hydrogenophaga sp.]|uniref:hypothetical protein n=1 Tax=Hydrogenophaga sp. TaxID=1904254 RepID=UPI00257BB134|nr:hypothetical protein [Hydrogenophaga sp.]MBL0946235.1 hypothetical protein [Hydrogenophaga sp.]